MNRLANTLRDQGELDDARYLFELGHEIRAETLGSDHPDTLTALDEVAITLVYQGDSDGERDLFEQVIEGRTRTLGAEHPDTIRVKDNLAIVTSALETAEPTPAD